MTGHGTPGRGPICPTCKRPVAWHGHKAKHQRPCGPQSNTAVGPRNWLDLWRYLAARSR
jgi:hypothetical protein